MNILFLLFQVTKDVSLLSRWMAIDLYVREVDSLRFELSMNQCSEQFARLAHEILEKGLLSQRLLIIWSVGHALARPMVKFGFGFQLYV